MVPSSGALMHLVRKKDILKLVGAENFFVIKKFQVTLSNITPGFTNSNDELAIIIEVMVHVYYRTNTYRRYKKVEFDSQCFSDH